MREFPQGLEVASGRYRLVKLLRGTRHDGLWLARDRDRDCDVWVTMRSARHTHARAEWLTFKAFGIPLPLYIGPPDLYTPDGQDVRDGHVCVVDDIPEGVELAGAGRLAAAEGIQLGADLCDVVASWAAVADGYVLRGLRPETIFVSAETHRFTGVTPRPYFLLGNSEFDAYPYLSFDPPTLSCYIILRHDAVFTLALVVWWAITGAHPYIIPGTSTDKNLFEDRRIPFDGPRPLGALLEAALVAEVEHRIELEALKAGFIALL